ncbi:MAG: hypothetical protein M3O99_12595 [Chloroflexota bacterium]|nr:hypothetical protein [Chloroflexota bacterium]
MRPALALTVVAAVLAAAAPAAARIAVQHGIAGAELRMTKAQVRARLGRPKTVRTGRNDFGRYSGSSTRA